MKIKSSMIYISFTFSQCGNQKQNKDFKPAKISLENGKAF